MRGAVSVALVYYYYDTEEGDTDPDHATLISMTLTVVLFSTLAFGAVTKPLLDFMLGVEDHGEAPLIRTFLSVSQCCACCAASQENALD